MDGLDKLFGAGIVVLVLAQLAIYSGIGYVVYLVLQHFNII